MRVPAPPAPARSASRRATALVTALTALVGALVGAGCRRQPRPAVAPARVGPVEDHCWWTVFRTTLPPDTVAARFARTFTTLGLSGAAWSHQADTAWAQAGPTVLRGVRAGGRYAARAVAYQRGDSTHFRWFAAIAPPRGGWTEGERVSTTGRHIGFCGEIGRGAMVHGVAPHAPSGEDTLSVWRRRQ